MTILSKVISLQGKQDAENTESCSMNGTTHNQGALPSHSQEKGRDTANWQVAAREEKRSPLHNIDDSLDTGPSHSKRRHKASPLRISRNKARDRPSSGSPSASTSGNTSESVDNDSGGYNSSDEYDSSQKSRLSEEQWLEKDRLFEKKMRKQGFLVKNMSDDGACLFRAVADQVYGDQEMHPVVRKHCMDYMATNSDYFSQYVTEDFSKYISRKRQAFTHGNHIEMQALSEMYNRRIEVFCYGKDPINIFGAAECNDNEPIRLSYQRGSHYNSIVDPHKATIGVGLGLPNFNPGSAENTLIKDALRQSEDFHIEQAMLEDKLRATDWEATNEAIEEQVARESYFQWLRENEKKGSRKVGDCSGGSSVAENDDRSSSSKSISPKPSTVNSSRHFLSEDDSLEISDQMFGIAEWEDGILAQVLAASAQEYLDNLKKKSEPNNSEPVLEPHVESKPSTSR